MATTPAAAPVDYNIDYLKTPAGLLRLGEGALALVAIISSAEGSVCDVGWNYGFFLFVSVISLIHSILVLIVIVLRSEKKITIISVPLTLLLNDSLRILVYFLATVMMMLAIGRCHYMIGARIVATISGIAGTLVLVGLSYHDYRWWKGEETPDSTETRPDSTGTRPDITETRLDNEVPVTSSSSTAVLTLS